MLEDYEESISLSLRTRSSKKPLGMLEKLETPMAPAMPFKTCKKSKQAWRDPWQDLMISSLNLHVSWKPVNPQECVWKNLYQITMRTISQDRGRQIHYNITSWYTNLFLCLKQWRYPQQKQWWIKNGRNLKRILAWDLTKSQKQIWGDRWSKDEGRKSSFCLINGHLSFEKCWIGGKSTKNTKVRVVLWGDIVGGDSRVLCSVHWTRIISITNNGRKSHGYHIQIARVRRTISGRSICLYPGDNGRCFKIIENSKVRMSRYLDTCTEAQVAKIMVQYGRSSRSSWTKSVWSSFGRTIVGKAIWESSFGTRSGKRFELGMFIC